MIDDRVSLRRHWQSANRAGRVWSRCVCTQACVQGCEDMHMKAHKVDVVCMQCFTGYASMHH